MKNSRVFKDRRSSNEKRNVNNPGQYYYLTTGAVLAFSLWNGGG